VISPPVGDDSSPLRTSKDRKRIAKLEKDRAKRRRIVTNRRRKPITKRNRGLGLLLFVLCFVDNDSI
jgi:hypothetical protein